MWKVGPHLPGTECIYIGGKQIGDDIHFSCSVFQSSFYQNKSHTHFMGSCVYFQCGYSVAGANLMKTSQTLRGGLQQAAALISKNLRQK